MTPITAPTPLWPAAVVLIAKNAGEFHQVLSGRTDAEDAHLPVDIAQFGLDLILGFPCILADQMPGISQFGGAVVNVEVNPSSGDSLEDDRIKPGGLHEGAHKAIRLGRGGAMGQAAFRA